MFRKRYHYLCALLPHTCFPSMQFPLDPAPLVLWRVKRDITESERERAHYNLAIYYILVYRKTRRYKLLLKTTWLYNTCN